MHHNDIHFSNVGTLKNTIIELLDKSKNGYTAKELQDLLIAIMFYWHYLEIIK